jgi:glycine/D-amino acid oxidase-like deaminating enzyme/nitrite reductase/ring-hydroxylating ferredoxin subunit
MKSDSGESVSIWMTLADNFVTDGKLMADAHADVCIVGAGIAGMTTAYLLAREGKNVIVLENGVIGGGMTGRTTAHLTNALDDRYYHLETLYGEEGARLAAESHTAAINRIEAIVTDEEIDCDFERIDGYLFCPPEVSQNQLQKELDAAHRAGIKDVMMMDRAPIPDFDTGQALRFPQQAQFHPLKYLAGLTNAIRRDGGQIFTYIHATDIVGGPSPHVKIKDGFQITADAIVVATNTPVNNRFAIHSKQAAYTTYVIGARVPKNSVAKALYWDTATPYHYVRVADGEDDNYDVLIVGGEDHKTGQANDANHRFAALEQWTKYRFPMIEDILFQWSGQVMEPIDSLAFIGRNPLDQSNVFIATGDSGNGMTHGTIAGILLTDLIMGRENRWQALYDPSRKLLRALPEFIENNFNVVVQYADLVNAGDVASTNEIMAGEGAVVRHGLKKVAVYRDKAGHLHEYSAVCVHLGGIVHWNSKEKTWDCPCHGSRFSAYGKVIHGPANSDLPMVIEEKQRRTA